MRDKGESNEPSARVVPLDVVSIRQATTMPVSAGLVRPPRQRHHPSVGRGDRYRPDGACHPRRHPPPSITAATRVAAIRAPKLNENSGTVRPPCRKTSQSGLDEAVCGRTADPARGRKGLRRGHGQATRPSTGSPWGEFWLATVDVVAFASRRRKHIVALADFRRFPVA